MSGVESELRRVAALIPEQSTLRDVQKLLYPVPEAPNRFALARYPNVHVDIEFMPVEGNAVSTDSLLAAKIKRISKPYLVARPSR